MRYYLNWQLILIFISIFIIVKCSKDHVTSPEATEKVVLDWEGEVGKFNDAYRDSILFSSDRTAGSSFSPSVHIMYKDGSGIRALTNQWFTFAATWSPRKWKVLFIADTTFSGTPARSLYIMNADGTGKHRITDASEDIWGISCSPDGKKIAYIVLNSSGEGKIRVANPDGSNGHDITGFFGPNTFHTVSWSKDSYRIAYDGASNGIGVVNADGTNNGSLFTWNYQCGEPNWSPDGNKVAFVSLARRDSNYYSNLFYFEVTTSTVHQVTTTDTFDSGPDWSPDGNEIIFSSQPPGLPSTVPVNIFVVNFDGTGRTQITNGMHLDSYPSW